MAGALEVPLAELFQDEEDSEAGAWRLVALVRERGLARAEVDRLLAVAEALFAEPPASSRPARPASRCEVSGCGRPVLARRLCGAHYHRARRARPSPGG